MAYPYDPNNLLLMDGTSAIKDLILGTFFTVAGTPTTAALLGAIAPTISATEYTSCSIATPFTAGQAISIMCVVNTAWAGNDGVSHMLFSTHQGSTTNRIGIQKDTANNLLFYIYVAGAGTVKQLAGAVNATNWAAGTHIVIVTRSAAGSLSLTLDGVALTTASGTGTGLETALDPNIHLGSYAGTSNYLTGSTLCAMWGRVLTGAEITALSSLAAWSTLTTPTDVRRRAKYIGG